MYATCAKWYIYNFYNDFDKINVDIRITVMVSWRNIFE